MGITIVKMLQHGRTEQWTIHEFSPGILPPIISTTPNSPTV